MRGSISRYTGAAGQLVPWSSTNCTSQRIGSVSRCFENFPQRSPNSSRTVLELVLTSAGKPNGKYVAWSESSGGSIMSVGNSESIEVSSGCSTCSIDNIIHHSEVSGFVFITGGD